MLLDIELANLRSRNSPDIQIRNTQAASLKERFLQTLRRYQQSESSARQQYQGRMARQYKIVRPDATEDEIQQALESDNQQIFAQSVGVLLELDKSSTYHVCANVCMLTSNCIVHRFFKAHATEMPIVLSVKCNHDTTTLRRLREPSW